MVRGIVEYDTHRVMNLFGNHVVGTREVRPPLCRRLFDHKVVTDKATVRRRPVKDLRADSRRIVAVCHREPIDRIEAVIKVLHHTRGTIGTANAERNLEHRRLLAKTRNFQHGRRRAQLNIGREGHLDMETFNRSVPLAVIGSNHL